MTRSTFLRALALSAALLSATSARAGSDTAARDLTQAECGACHMAYPAAFLPQRSWQRIMSTLDSHFGEDASLDDQSRAEIEAYLVKNAADGGLWSSRALRGVPDSETPLRISELPWFVREHDREVSSRAKARAGSMSNCTACHRAAGRGSFDDD